MFVRTRSVRVFKTISRRGVMAIATINPATGEILKTFEPLSDSQLEEKLQRAACTFTKFRNTSFADRASRMMKAAELLESRKQDFARVMTIEMGKTYRSAVDEVAKCAWVSRYYGEKGKNFRGSEPANGPPSALLIEDVLLPAGFPEGVFQTLLIGSNKVGKILADPRVKAATLTGSEGAGVQVGIAAATDIKKVVLELGGR